MAVIRDTDNGYKALVQRVFGMAKEKPKIDVGILSGAGADEMETHGLVSILQVAIWNEFGTQDIPARSFIRAWFDEQEPELRQTLVRLMKEVVAGRQTTDSILELLGQKAVGQIQQRIADGIEPPNAQRTVEQKGSSTPLINTGALRTSVSYRIGKGE